MAAHTLLCVLFLSICYTWAQDFCTSRIPPGSSPEADILTGICPYHVYAESWIPGQPTAMTLSSLTAGDDVTFQSFLVSVQRENSLIGVMAPDENDLTLSNLTCESTSIQQADLSNKTTVSFTWTAPKDLDPSTSVIVRWSVGEDINSIWPDCDAFVLESSPDIQVNDGVDTGADETPSDLASEDDPSSQVVDDRVAGPDIADDNSPSTSDSQVECKQSGISYKTVPGNKQSFIMEWDIGGQQVTQMMMCPPTLEFNTKQCVCSRAQV